MKIELFRASLEDAQELWEMQVLSFQRLMDKYQDYDTNPANEPVDKIIARLNQKETYYYFICMDRVKVGAVRVVDFQSDKKKTISPLFILPKYRSLGIAQEVIKMCEKIHGFDNWELATILQEEGNCHLYEKLGYKKLDKQKQINDRMALIFYGK